MKRSTTDYQTSRGLQKIAGRIQRDLKRLTNRDDIGFSLIVFQTADNSRSSYISNCNREDVTGAMKELLDRWEEGMPDIPAHEVN